MSDPSLSETMKQLEVAKKGLVEQCPFKKGDPVLYKGKKAYVSSAFISSDGKLTVVLNPCDRPRWHGSDSYVDSPFNGLHKVKPLDWGGVAERALGAARKVSAPYEKRAYRARRHCFHKWGDGVPTGRVNQGAFSFSGEPIYFEEFICLLCGKTTEA